jgi:hypothetical protein
MFSSNNISTYVATLGIVLVVSYFATNMKQSFESNDEYDIIRKYLLNDSPLYGFNKPKLWIHTKYEINSRRWKDFYSRNTTDLNQPYIHLTIKTIINHCGNDFNICLIDDESFSKLIPSWDVDLKNVAEPMKTHFRELGLAQLIYFYGGMIVPNSFVCLKNLKELYEEGISNNSPFVCESINRTVNVAKQKHKLLFVPDLYFMGAAKNNSSILELVEYLKTRNKNPHFSTEIDLVGDSSQWLIERIDSGKFNLISGERIGIKTQDRKTILLENLMEEAFLNLSTESFGLYIPADEILVRTKFQWFAVLPSEQILKSNMIVSKYLTTAIVNSSDEYYKKNEMRSVVAL